MKHSSNIINYLVSCSLLATACTVADVNEPRGSLVAPKQIEVTRVENQNGQAIIYYNLPDDTHFKYVKAVYRPRTGVTTEVKASYFTDSLIVNGFEKAGDFTVDLYSVSSGEAQSEPVKVTVSPLEPPYLLAANTVKMVPDWGGVRFEARNPMEKKLIYSIEQKDTVSADWTMLGQYVSTDSVFTFALRNMEAVPREFRYYVEDYWGNKSDQVEVELTPWYEEEVDKTPWKLVIPPGEFAIQGYSTSVISHMWDGNNMQQHQEGWQIKSKTYTFPLAWTIDLGDSYHLSRLEEWAGWSTATGPSTRYEKYYNGIDIKDFELYGAETLDMENPLFDSGGNLNPNWTFLGFYTNARPSGSLLTIKEEACTELEEYYFANRIPRNFELPADAPYVRYFKMRLITNWGMTNDNVNIAEISLYGQRK